MPDISKCNNQICIKRKKCWRFTAPNSEFRQAWGDFEPKRNSETSFRCDYFIGIPVHDKYLKKK